MIIRTLTDFWMADLATVILLAIFCGGIGLLAVKLMPSLKRFLAGELILDRRVDDQAAIAFMEKEVFNTRGRTGILIFLSLFERRVRIIGDTHINDKVKPEEWEGIVQTVVKEIRSGEAAQGLIGAISQCGEFLRRRGIKKETEDINELPNQMNIGDIE
jgi:putative membrane protein